MSVRVCLDLNVFIAAEIAGSQGASSTTPVRLVEACRSGRVELVISRRMLDRFVTVLTRHPRLKLTLEAATARADLLGDLTALSNLLVVGGRVAPLADEEDRGVLDTALAGNARYLATYNLSDFEAAAIRDEETEFLRVADVLIVHPADLAEVLGI